MKVEIKETQAVKLRNPTLIEGFPGIGMIGTISSAYLSYKLGMRLVGYMASSQFPPISAIHDYKPVSPARIYASEKHDLLVLFSEFVIPANIVYPLSQEIIKFAKKKKVKTIYSLAGIAAPKPTDKIHGIPSTDAVAELLKKNGIELIKEGATQGVSGVLIAECASEKVPAANVLAETRQPLDPRASARLLDKMNDLAGLNVDTKDLVKEAEKVEENMRDAIQKMHALHSDYKKMESNPMYG